MKSKTIISISFLIFIILMVLFSFFGGCDGGDKKQTTTVNHTKETVDKETFFHKETISFDTAKYLKWVTPQILLFHKTKAIYSPLPAVKNKKDSIIVSICDSLNYYSDTLISNGIIIYSTIETRGNLLSHNVFGKIEQLVITEKKETKDSTEIRTSTTTSDSININKNSGHGIKQIGKNIKLFAGGILTGAVATITAVIYFLKP